MTNSRSAEISPRSTAANAVIGLAATLSPLMSPFVAYANDGKFEYPKPITSQTTDSKLEFPSRVALTYPEDDIILTLDFTGYYKVKRFEVTVRANRFLIPEDACEKFGVRIEQLSVIRETGDDGKRYFQVRLYGNQKIGEGRSLAGHQRYEIVPTCEITFDGDGFRNSQPGTDDAARLAPPRDQTRKWNRTPEE